MNSFVFRPVGTSLEERLERNRLLQTTLRAEFDCAYGIECEYPLVLSSFSSKSSFGLFDSSNILVSHVNLLFRNLRIDGVDSNYKLTLVGNVATHPNYQGKGLMRLLFEHIETFAKLENSLALILWSDLDLFYQKLGFMSVGKEVRFLLNLEKLARKTPIKVHTADASTYSSKNLTSLMALRPRTPIEIHRSPSEFLALLSIPDCHLYVADDHSSYFVIGKGCDMKGVIHEWGAATPECLIHALSGLTSLIDSTQELCILAPSLMESKWLSTLRSFSKTSENHPMGWKKDTVFDDKITARLDELFIWGLDSI